MVIESIFIKNSKIQKILTLGLFVGNISSAMGIVLPNSGTELQNIPQQPIPFKAEPNLPEAQSPSINLNQSMSGPVIQIMGLAFTGNTVFENESLLELIGFKAPQSVNLDDLKRFAEIITNHYNKQGYFLAKAYLPQQDVVNGVVTIAVFEGHYGQVKLKNSTSINENTVKSLASELKNSDLVTIQSLERTVLMLNDLPGADVKSVLSPGKEIGTTDLTLAIEPSQQFSSVINVDNAGNIYTGAYRASVSGNLNEIVGLGDSLSIYGLMSNLDMRYLKLGYTIQTGQWRIGVASTHLSYALGGTYSSLGASGTSDIASLNASYPLVRNRTTNANLQFSIDNKSNQYLVSSQSSVIDKTVRVLTSTLSGDFKTKGQWATQTNYSFNWAIGDVNLISAEALASDQATSQTNGNYNKLSASFGNLVFVSNNTTLSTTLSGQVTNKNLDATEKMVLGGANGVRAYPAGEGIGDEGYILSMEAQKKILAWDELMPGQLQAGAFLDTGTVIVDKAPWVVGINRETISSVGLGFHWGDAADKLDFKTYLAHKVGNMVSTTAPDVKWRIWLTGSMYF